MGWGSGWLPVLWSLASGQSGAVQAPALGEGLRRQRLLLAGRPLEGGQLQPLLAPALAEEALARGGGTVVWYCLGPGAQGYRATAHCRRTWRGWQVGWQLQAVDGPQLQQALAADRPACERVFGRLRGQRLYA